MTEFEQFKRQARNLYNQQALASEIDRELKYHATYDLPPVGIRLCYLRAVQASDRDDSVVWTVWPK